LNSAMKPVLWANRINLGLVCLSVQIDKCVTLHVVYESDTFPPHSVDTKNKTWSPFEGKLPQGWCYAAKESVLPEKCTEVGELVMELCCCLFKIRVTQEKVEAMSVEKKSMWWRSRESVTNTCPSSYSR
ncbi:hypothetical protein JOQ06_011992, partial [Pogonophryne albipinna]